MTSFFNSCKSKFVWKIENFSCLKGESFFSPPTPLVIVISQEDSHIFAYCNDWRIVLANYTFSFSFLDSNGAPLICKENILKAGESFEKDAFKFPNETKYFPHDILTVECRIWKEQANVHYYALPIFTHTFVHTQLEPISKVIKKTFNCVISEIIESESNFSETICNDQNLEIKIVLPYSGQVFVYLTTRMFGFNAKIQVSMIYATGKKIEFGNHNAKFESGNRSCQFNINASRNMLKCHKNKFLMSDTPMFIFNCTFTGHFATDSIVEESEILNSRTTTYSGISEVSEAETKSNETDTNSNEPGIRHPKEPGTVSQALQKMLSEGYLSDFTLKVGDRTFPVHKSVLGVRSKVFRSMFASEMKEMQDNCVDIKDVDGDTLHRMLEFVYSDRLDKDMDWADASSLYAAADFYALEPLKVGCSTILKEGLSVASALGVLALADLHQDRQLKSAALDFISLNDQDIIDTDHWIKFEEGNAKLALETLRKLYSKKMKE